MGTPDFAVPALDAVVAAGHTVAAVFTQPDKPKGRGFEMTPPPVKKRALELGLSVFQPVSVKTGDAAEQIESIAADCIVVAAYGKILPERVLCAAKYGCINIHSSLLPKYRGPAPINWAVINGDSVTGVSTMQLDAGVDTGDVLMTAETPIGENETAGELHDRLAAMGAELLLETLKRAESGTLEPKKQDESQASRAPMLDKSLCAVDWTQSAQAVHNRIRGLHPWPVATAVLGGRLLKLHASRVVDSGTSGRSGEVLSAEPLIVACGSGAIELLEVQGENARRMPAADYLRGHPIALG